MSTQPELCQETTNRIIESLNSGNLPRWRQPWSSHINAGSPTNVISKKRYGGVNPLLLRIAAARHGLKSKYWATFNQWKDLGGKMIRRPDHVPPFPFAELAADAFEADVISRVQQLRWTPKSSQKTCFSKRFLAPAGFSFPSVGEQPNARECSESALGCSPTLAAVPTSVPGSGARNCLLPAVHGLRRAVLHALVGTLGVIELEVLAKSHLQCLNGVVSVQV